MEMKINLDKIFGISKTEETVIDSAEDNSQNIETDSLESFNLRYNFNMEIFDDNDSRELKKLDGRSFKTASIKTSELN